MKKRAIFYGWVMLLLFGLIGCSNHPNESALKEDAEQLSNQVSQWLTEGHLDSIERNTLGREDILIYVYEQGWLSYWSDNRLAVPERMDQPQYDVWVEAEYANARVLTRWTQVGYLDILTVIPIEWKAPNTESLEKSFSYRALLSKKEKGWNASNARIHAYNIISYAIVALALVEGIVVLIRRRGFNNLKVGTKFRFVAVALMLLNFVVVWMMSVTYVEKRYKERQMEELEQKKVYVQSVLQQLYYWTINLGPENRPGMNIDLRDLAYQYGTDIHVYDMNGRLVASSSPMLFITNVLTPRMASLPYFDRQINQVIEERLGDTHYLTTYTEFQNGHYMQIGYIALPSFLSEDEMAMEVNDYLSRLLPPFLLVILIALGIAFAGARWIIAPVKELGDKMKHFSLQNRDNHLTYLYNDEVGDLVQHYNEMVDQLTMSTEQLAQAERESTWRTMARLVAHEINNSLTPIKLSIQQLQRLKGSEKFDEYFQKTAPSLVEEIDRLSRFATSSSTIAKTPQIKVSEVDIAECLTQSISIQQNNPENIPIRYLGADHGIMAMADEEQIGQVFTNLLKNAVQAINDRADGDIIVILKDLDDEVEVSVSDNGPGIPEEIQSKIFTPNFTTKSTGTGLGLAFSRSIVEGCGGKISFETSAKGTVFYVQLKKKH